MVEEKGNFKKRIIDAIDSLDINLEILKDSDLTKEIARITGIDISTIRKNEEYYNLCVEGFKRHIAQQFILNNKNNNINFSKKDVDLNSENDKLKKEILALEQALSQKTNYPDMIHLLEFYEDLIVFLKSKGEVEIKNDMILLDNTVIIQNAIILLLKK